jgi:hypothetical protein
MGDVKAVGERSIWLESGRIRASGPTDQVVAKYLAAMSAKDSRYLEHAHQPGVHVDKSVAPPEVVTTIPNIDHRHGDRRAEIIGIAVFTVDGEPMRLLEPSSRVIVRISARANDGVAMPNVGFMLRNHLGIDLAGTNTYREGYDLPAMIAGDIVTVDFHIDLPALYPGSFSFSPAIADGTLHAYKMCDWIDNAIVLQMANGEGQVYGYLHLPCRVEVNVRLPDRTAEPAIG